MDPIYQPVLSHEVVDGRHILAIWAHGSFNRPHSLPGERAADRRFWVRLGPETVEARGTVLTELLQMTRWVPFDDQPAPRFDVYELRSTLVREFLKEVGSALIDEPDDREVYRAMQLVYRMNGHEAPRNVALLFFSDEPDRHFPVPGLTSSGSRMMQGVTSSKSASFEALFTVRCETASEFTHPGRTVRAQASRSTGGNNLIRLSACRVRGGGRQRRPPPRLPCGPAD